MSGSPIVVGSPTPKSVAVTRVSMKSNTLSMSLLMPSGVFEVSVTGVGTSFVSQVNVGDTIAVDGFNSVVVCQINSNTVLLTTTTAGNFAAVATTYIVQHPNVQALTTGTAFAPGTVQTPTAINTMLTGTGTSFISGNQILPGDFIYAAVAGAGVALGGIAAGAVGTAARVPLYFTRPRVRHHQTPGS